MTTRIRVENHIPGLIGLDHAGFADQVERLKRRLSRSNPVAVLTRRTIGGAVECLETASDRDQQLHTLLELDPAGAACGVLRLLTAEIPPAHGRITCHLIPNAGNRGSGNCFGDDRLLITVPCQGDALPWVGFVIAHEYSHTHRDFGEHEPDTVRDYLVFEGLAMVLAETLEVKLKPYPWDEVTTEQEVNFWTMVDPEARGLEAYMTYMGHDAAYETGARIVRAYLNRHRVSIVEVHRLPNDELYWGSGYPLLR